MAPNKRGQHWMAPSIDLGNWYFTTSYIMSNCSYSAPWQCPCVPLAGYIAYQWGGKSCCCHVPAGRHRLLIHSYRVTCANLLGVDITLVKYTLHHIFIFSIGLFSRGKMEAPLPFWVQEYQSMCWGGGLEKESLQSLSIQYHALLGENYLLHFSVMLLKN